MMLGGAYSAPHRSMNYRLRIDLASVAVAHGCPGDIARLDDQPGFDAERGTRPQNEISEAASLDRPDMCVDADRDRRIDCVFRYVTLDTLVVGACSGLFWQPANALLHDTRELPALSNILSKPPHPLRVSGEAGYGTHVVQEVLCCHA